MGNKRLFVTEEYLKKYGPSSEMMFLLTNNLGTRFSIDQLFAELRRIKKTSWEAWFLSQPLFCKSLLELGADVHAGNDFALCKASLYGYIDLVKELIKYGANVHVDNNYPLRVACEKGFVDLLRFYLLLVLMFMLVMNLFFATLCYLALLI